MNNYCRLLKLGLFAGGKDIFLVLIKKDIHSHWHSLHCESQDRIEYVFDLNSIF